MSFDLFPSQQINLTTCNKTNIIFGVQHRICTPDVLVFTSRLRNKDSIDNRELRADIMYF